MPFQRMLLSGSASTAQRRCTRYARGRGSWHSCMRVSITIFRAQPGGRCLPLPPTPLPAPSGGAGRSRAPSNTAHLLVAAKPSVTVEVRADGLQHFQGVGVGRQAARHLQRGRGAGGAGPGVKRTSRKTAQRQRLAIHARLWKWKPLSRQPAACR